MFGFGVGFDATMGHLPRSSAEQTCKSKGPMPPLDYGSVHFSGEFDLADHERINAALASIATAQNAFLDLRKMTYMDSTVLRCFTRFRNRRGESGSAAPAMLFEPTQLVARLLQITGLASVFPVAQAGEVAEPPNTDAKTVGPSSRIAVCQREGSAADEWSAF